MPDLWSQLYRDFVTAPWGDRWKLLERYQLLTGCSVKTLLRKIKGMGYDTGRDGNGGAGRALSDTDIQLIARYIRSSESKKGRMAMDTSTALLAARRTGLDVGASESTVRALLRENKISKQHMLAPAPHVQMRSLHPNHVHQVDATACVQWHLKDTGLAARDPDLDQLYKPEKLKKIKQHLLRYLLTDHLSGAFFVRYYYAAGETWANLFDFLFNHAWRVKPEWIRQKYPFAHVPRLLVWDQGSANQSAVIGRILNALEVEHVPHMPGNPRAKGAVERGMWLWECTFESLLRLDPPRDLEDLNHKALDMCAYLNATKKLSRTGMPRTALWSTIRAEQIRKLPPLTVIQALAHTKPEKRKVEGGLIIRYGGLSYDVRHVPGIAPGDRVEVMVNPYRHPDVTVAYEGRTYTAQAVQFLPGIQGGFRADAVVWGEYRAQKDTPAATAGKRMDAGMGTARRAPTGQILGGLHEDIPDVTYIDRTSRAAEIPLAAAVEPRDLPRLKAAQWIRDELGESWRPWMAKSLKEQYGDTVPEAELPAIMERLTQGVKHETERTAAVRAKDGAGVH